MKYIFLIAVFNAFFFTVLLFQKKQRALHDKILIIWLIYLGLFIGIYSFYSHDLFTHFKLLSISLISLFMLHGPFLYFYVLTLVSGNRLSGKDIWNLAPFLLFNIYLLICSFNPEAAGKLNIEQVSAGYDPPLLFLFFLILTLLSGTFYFLLTIKLFRELDIKFFNNYSSSADIDPVWLKKLVLVFGIVWTALILVTVIHHVFNMFSMVFCTDGLFLSLSFFVILIGYFGLRQKVIFTSGDIVATENDSKGQVKYAGSKLSENDAKLHAERLTSYMKSSKPFLNPDLTLPQLATEMGISTHLLSQVINEQFKLNFFDFVNGFRVDAFKERVADPSFKNYSLLGIALECGFNSKSAFNRIFKKTTGLTPSRFRESSDL